MGKVVQILYEVLKRVDSDASIFPVANPINIVQIVQGTHVDLPQETRETELAFAHDEVINPGTFQNRFRGATDMGASHHDDPALIFRFDHSSDGFGLAMVRGEGGRDPKNIGVRLLHLFIDLPPPHSEMVVPSVKLKGASVVIGIDLSKVGEFGRNWDRRLPSYSAVKDFDVMPIRL